MAEADFRVREADGAASDFTRPLFNGDPNPVRDGHTPRIVASVFERFQRIENRRASVNWLTHVPENATHPKPPA
jgi:hypothetical protein